MIQREVDNFNPQREVDNFNDKLDFIKYHEKKIDDYKIDDNTKQFIKNTFSIINKTIDNNGNFKSNLLMQRNFNLCRSLLNSN